MVRNILHVSLRLMNNYIYIYIYIYIQSAVLDWTENCFAVLDSAGTAYKLKIKEVLHINWEGPNLNKQLNPYNISLNF